MIMVAFSKGAAVGTHHTGLHIAAIPFLLSPWSLTTACLGAPCDSCHALWFTARILLSCCLLFTGLPPSVAGWIVSRQLQQSGIQKVLPVAAQTAVA